jgi:hypothetical protein
MIAPEVVCGKPLDKAHVHAEDLDTTGGRVPLHTENPVPVLYSHGLLPQTFISFISFLVYTIQNAIKTCMKIQL